VEDGILTITPSQHFADPDQARSVIESGLRAREIYAGLNLGGVEAFRFEYQSARVIDRDPPSDEPEALSVTVTELVDHTPPGQGSTLPSATSTMPAVRPARQRRAIAGVGAQR
jgi:hypothetical protein